MNEQPTRKEIRLKSYDYSSSGAYFVTICSKGKEKIFWSEDKFRAYLQNCDFKKINLTVSYDQCLSMLGEIIVSEIENMNDIYASVSIDKYCVMPDHIHMILLIQKEEANEPPTLSRIIKQFKGSISKKAGSAIWQKSFYDHIIRNQDDYNNVWEYIDKNPLKYLLKKAPF